MDRYLAFISYRHKYPDQTVSELLRKGLEGPSLPADAACPKPRRVFRDTDELPTSADLGVDIENALRDSGFLIALCSREYLTSRWCMREIELFISMGRRDRILPVLVDDEPEEAVPAPIADLPIAADLRAPDERERRRKAREAVPALLARILDIPAVRIEAAERRRRALTAIGIVGAVSAALFAFGIYAVRTGNRIARINEEVAAAAQTALQAEQEAIEQRDDALMKTASYLSGEAWKAVAAGDDDTAVALAMQALPEDLNSGLPVSRQALNVLRYALNMPSKPKAFWLPERTIEFDFTIEDVSFDRNSNILLEPARLGAVSHMLAYGTLQYGTVENAKMAEMVGLGYERYRYEPYIAVWYGRGRPLATGKGYYDICRLDGEPFYADHAVCAGDYVLGWCEEPFEGQEARAALFYQRYSTTDPIRAVFALDPAVVPVSAAFSPNRRRLAVVDRDGVLRQYETGGGEELASAGGYAAVYYGDANDYFYAVTEGGALHRLDAVTLREHWSYTCPAAILGVQYCPARGELLLRCADGFRVIEAETQRTVFEYKTDETPKFAFYADYDSSLFWHDGKTILLVFDRRVEICSLSRKTGSDCYPLYTDTASRVVGRAFYSPQGDALYLSYFGRGLCKFSADDGSLIWKKTDSGTADSGVPDHSYLSADGSALWRSTYDGDGMERIDAETGETLWSVRLIDGNHCDANVKESPDGRMILCVPTYGGLVFALDPHTGETLWESPKYGTPCFAADGKTIEWLKTSREGYDEEERQFLLHTRTDAETGALLSQTELFRSEGNGFLTADTMRAPDGRPLAFLRWRDDSYRGGMKEHTVCIYDLTSREKLAEARIEAPDYFSTEALPGEDGLLLSWRAPNGEGDETAWHCRMALDGTLSPAEEDDPNGPLGFADELLRVFGRRDGVIESPNGESCCLYSGWSTPMLLKTVPDEALLAQAKERMGGAAK